MQNSYGISEETLKKTSEYIEKSWKNAVKKHDCDKTFPLPYDYIPPCVDGDLTNLFYWDTYFTNLGLYLDGMGEYCYNNIECLRYCLEKFGCVPNMCRATGADYASQPPLLYLMINDYFNFKGDKKWLETCVNSLEKEYSFWMSKRLATNGLNRYGTNFNYEYAVKNKKEYYFAYGSRVGLDVSKLSDDEIINMAINAISEGESGEDHTPRFSREAFNINPVDLNSYLYGFERTLARFCEILGKGGANVWLKRAEARKELMDKYLLDPETGVYFDYNYITGKRTGVYAAACYLPFVFGISCNKTALEKINNKLIMPHGVASCQEMPPDGQSYQWGYPNSWAPHNYWAFVANDVMNNVEAREKIRYGWLETVASEFEKGGKLYEKYDGLNGGKAMVNEYGLPEMLGWTAGVYQKLYKTR